MTNYQKPTLTKEYFAWGHIIYYGVPEEGGPNNWLFIENLDRHPYRDVEEGVARRNKAAGITPREDEEW